MDDKSPSEIIAKRAKDEEARIMAEIDRIAVKNITDITNDEAGYLFARRSYMPSLEESKKFRDLFEVVKLRNERAAGIIREEKEDEMKKKVENKIKEAEIKAETERKSKIDDIKK